MNTFTPLQLKNKALFKQHQKLLLQIINSEEGKELLGIKDNGYIVKVTPNSWHFLRDFDKKGRAILGGHFFCYEKAAKFLLPILEKIEILQQSKYRTDNILDAAKFYTGYRGSKYPQIFLTTETYYSGVGDGRVNITGQGSWSAARDASNGTSAIANSPYTICQPQADGGWRVDRAFFPFDTSAIPDGVSITSATCNIMTADTANHHVDTTIHLVTTTQASNTALVTEDFDQMGAVDQASAINTSAMTVNTYNSWSLNATGIGNISLTGYTKLGLRTGHDVSNTACTNSTNNTSNRGFFSSANAGVDKDPYLEIIYPGDPKIKSLNINQSIHRSNYY